MANTQERAELHKTIWKIANEYKMARRHGLSPTEALEDWDLLPCGTIWEQVTH